MADVPTFVFDENYDNTEQVRPYFAAYMAVRGEITGNGAYPDNESFKGRITGLADSEHEDTAIYLLQRLHTLEEEQAQADAFTASGGRPLAEFALNGDSILRGTLARRGWYMGGTGWSVTADVRVTVKNNQVLFKGKGQRSWRTHHDSPDRYLFRPA